MTLDLIEIALDRFTDWAKFEKLASEIMRDEGYPDIKPLGGVRDSGQDAVVERFFYSEGRRLRVVFQFTLRSDVPTKAKGTLARLTDVGTAFQKLVIVTPARISAETQEAIKKKALREYSVGLDVFDRKTLVNRLADPTNGLFQRYFPDIGEQARVLLEPRRAALQAKQEREEEFLKVCCAFTFAPGGQRTRKSLLDEMVFAIMVLSDRQPITPETVVARAREMLSADILVDADQVAASLQRLAKKRLVEASGAGFSLTMSGRVRAEAARISLEALQRSIVRDIVGEVCGAASEPIAENHLVQLEENALQLLAEYFRINGLELAHAFLSKQKPVLIYLQEGPRLLGMAKQRVPAHLGDLLVTAVGRALCSPTDEEARYLACCSRAYIALQVMNLDPSLREFQASRFSGKTFILDTDFVLDAITREVPESATSRELVARLRGLGARVLVPQEVLVEVATHLEIAPGTYKYFGDAIAALSEELARARIWNALVLGYWYRARAQGWATRADFMEYRENYFEVADPVGFVTDVVGESLPGVEIGEARSVLGVALGEEEVEKASSVLMEIVTGTPKGLDRTENQNRELAKHDARLMIAVVKHNEADGEARGGVLGRRAYIVTSSGRYLRAAQKLGIQEQLSSRPHILAALVELIGPSAIDDRQFVRLFENSLLQQAVEACWTSVKVLLDAGLELKDTSITRLRYDVEKRLNMQIADLQRADALAAEREDAPADSGDKEHIALLRGAEPLGYRATRLVARLVEQGQFRESELAKLAAENEELREAVKRFGRKKERWLRRMDRERGRQ